MALFIVLSRNLEGQNLKIDVRIPIGTWDKVLSIAEAAGLNTKELIPKIPSHEDLLKDEVSEGFKPKLISNSLAASFASVLEDQSSLFSTEFSSIVGLIEYLKLGQFHYVLFNVPYHNPFFDEVFALLQDDFPIPTKQTNDESKIKEFKRRVEIMLTQEMSRHKSWPHKGKLLVMVSIDCPQTYISRVDVDNFLKLLFDLFKKFVYDDDKQIYKVLADKHVHPKNMIGFSVGIKKIHEDDYFKFWPSLKDPNDL